MEKALIEKTKQAIHSISELETIKPYYLVGGTALSIQIEHRLSEDLDFMRWQKTKDEPMEVDISSITKELIEKKHIINSTNILEKNHVEFQIDGGIKLSFYAPEKREPKIKTVPFLNNINLVDTNTIATLKMETMLRRSNFRDYYDLYFILKNKKKSEIVSIIDNALKYSGHNMKSKNLIGKLCNYEKFIPDNDFKNLNPQIDITPQKIAEFMNNTVKVAYQNKNQISM